MKRDCCRWGIEISKDTFYEIAFKLQDELAEIILEDRQVSDYELIVYKYVFIGELKIPLQDDFGFEMAENSFILYIIPDNLEFDVLRRLDDAFDRFRLIFMPNSYGLLKIRFVLSEKEVNAKV